MTYAGVQLCIKTVIVYLHTSPAPKVHIFDPIPYFVMLNSTLDLNIPKRTNHIYFIFFFENDYLDDKLRCFLKNMKSDFFSLHRHFNSLPFYSTQKFKRKRSHEVLCLEWKSSFS